MKKVQKTKLISDWVAYRNLIKGLFTMLFVFTLLPVFSQQISGSTNVCQGNAVTYSVASGTDASYSWTVTGGIITSPTSDTDNISVLWNSSGTGTVAITTFPTNQTNQVSVQVNAAPTPKVVNTVNLYCTGMENTTKVTITTGDYQTELYCLTACENSTATYFTTLNAGSTYVWEVTGGTITSGANSNEVEVTWGAQGIGTVKVTESNGSGCVGTSETCVQLIKSPVALFSALPAIVGNQINVCLGQTVYFTDLSTGATTWSWNFGDGYVSGTQNPQHTYLVPGTYTVTLTVGNIGVGYVPVPDRPIGGGLDGPIKENPIRVNGGGGGNTLQVSEGPIKIDRTPREHITPIPEPGYSCNCQDTYSITVVVENTPAPIIECVGPVCAGDTTTYSTPSGCTNLDWTVTGGTILSTNANEVTVIWGSGATGPGYITLDVNGCAGYCNTPAVVRVPIVPTTAVINGPTVVCLLSEEKYSVPFIPGTAYTWTVTNGDIVAGEGTNEIIVFWSDNSPSTNTVSVSYYNDFLECGGTGTLTVQAVADYLIAGPTRVCAGSTAADHPSIAFESVDITFVPSNWSVITPAGTLQTNVQTNSTLLNSYTFTTPGTYVIIGKPASGLFCNTEAQISIEVIAPPVAPAGINGPASVCPGSTNTYYAVQNIANPVYNWTVIGGTPSSATGSSISVTWNATGPYSLSLTQTYADVTGCTSSPFVMNVSSKLPITAPAITGVSPVCLGGNSAYSFSGAIIPGATYRWSIVPANTGNIITSALNTNSINVSWGTNNNVSTTATIVLEVTLCGQTVSSSYVVNLDAYTPDFTFAEPICVNTSVQYTPTAGTVYTEWSFSDGSPTISTMGANPVSHTYTVPGTYSINLVAQNNLGCQKRISKIVTIQDAPKAEITSPDPLDYCTGDTINVRLDAIINTASTYTYQWFKVGNPVSFSSTNPATATTAGYYYALVTNSSGCSAYSDTLQIIQTSCEGGCPIESHTANITYTLQNCGEVSFTPVLSSNLVVQSWTYLNTKREVVGYSSLDNPTHTFTEAGYYWILLSYKGPNGTTAEAGDSAICRTQIRVFIPIVANFGIEHECINNVMTTTLSDNSAYFAAGSTPIIIDSYSWYVDNALVSTSQNAVLNLTGGAHTVTLTIVSSAYNVSCTVTKNILVPQTPVAAMSFNPRVCPGEPVQFTNLSTGNIITQLWSFDATIADSDVENPIRTFNTAGAYTITLTVTDELGCYSTASSPLTVDTPENGTITVGGPLTICQGNNVLLTAPAGTDYSWSNGATTASINATLAGNYYVTLVGSNGCRYTTSFVTVTVKPKPVPTVTGTNVVCTNESIILSTNYGYTSYQWAFDAIPTEGNYTHVGFSIVGYSVQGSTATAGNYTVTVTDNNGCVGTSAPFSVIVNPLPATTVISGENAVLCEGTIHTLSVNNPVAGVTYYWNTGQIGTQIFAVDAGTYSVTAYNQYGCSSVSQPLIINRAPDVSTMLTGCYAFCRSELPKTISGPSAPTIGNLIIDFYTYAWYKDGVLYSTDQDLSVTEFGTYYLVVTNGAGCSSTSGKIVIDRLPESEVVMSATISCCKDKFICKGQSATIPVNFIGTGPWTFSYYDSKEDTTITVTTSNNPYNLVVTPSATSTYTLLSVTGSNVNGGCTEVCGEATIGVNECTAPKGRKGTTTADCSKNCFTSKITGLVDNGNGCKTVTMNISCNNTCMYSLSNFTISVQCGTVTSVSNSLGFLSTTVEEDPNSGLSGIKIDGISNFCGLGQASNFNITYTLCMDDNSCGTDFCAPMVAFKAGTCTYYGTATMAIGARMRNTDMNSSFSLTEFISATASETISEGMNVYPNPFNQTTAIVIGLTESAQVEVAIYDMMGKKLDVLHSGEMNAGTNTFKWSGTTQNGNKLPYGVYYIQSSINEKVEQVKLIYTE